MSAYHSNELFNWLEPLLTEEELLVGVHLEVEARAHWHLIPTGDQWA